MKALLACWLTAIAVLVWLVQPTTFAQRWAPVVEHPLHAVSAARAGFCYPGKCLTG